MAFTINNFWGAETGGLEELTSADASVTVDADAHSGGYSYHLTVTTQMFSVSPFQSVADAGGDYIFGMWIKGSFRVYFREGTTNNVCWILGANSGGGSIEAYDANSALIGTSTNYPGNTTTWVFVEVYFQHAASGAISVFVDGTEVITSTGEDLTNGGTFDTIYIGYFPWYFDDIYFASGATSADDRLSGCEVIGYRSNKASATPDLFVGSSFDLTGGTWANTQESPFSETNEAFYSGTPPGNGYGVRCDDLGGSTNGGPYNDSNITGTVPAIKGVFRAKRTNGSGTDHNLNCGRTTPGGTSYTSVITSTPTVLITTYANYFQVGGAGPAPDPSTEVAAIGFWKNSGGRDLYVSDMLAQILHVPSQVSGSMIYNPVRRMMPHLVR